MFLDFYDKSMDINIGTNSVASDNQCNNAHLLFFMDPNISIRTPDKTG